MAKNSVRAGIARIVGGTIGSQLIAMGTSLIIARLVLPDAFGVFAAVTGIVAVLGAVAGLRLEAAIPLPDSDDEARNILRATITVSTLVAITLALLIAAAPTILPSGFQVPRGDFHSLWLAPPAVFLTGTFNALNQYTLRERRYGVVALRSLSQALSTAGAQLIGVTLFPSATSLMAGFVIGQVVGIAVMTSTTKALGLLNPRQALYTLKKHRDFSLILTPTTFINLLGLQTPLLLGATLYGPAFAGWFGMTQRFLAVPVGVLATSFSQVAIGEFSAIIRTGDSERLATTFAKASKHLFVFGALGSALVALLGPWGLEFVLGANYAPSGEYARALALGLLFQILTSPLSTLLVLLHRTRLQATWDVVRLISVVLTISISWHFGLKATHMLFILSIAQAALYSAQWVLIRASIAKFSREPSE